MFLRSLASQHKDIHLHGIPQSQLYQYTNMIKSKPLGDLTGLHTSMIRRRRYTYWSAVRRCIMPKIEAGSTHACQRQTPSVLQYHIRRQSLAEVYLHVFLVVVLGGRRDNGMSFFLAVFCFALSFALCTRRLGPGRWVWCGRRIGSGNFWVMIVTLRLLSAWPVVRTSFQCHWL